MGTQLTNRKSQQNRVLKGSQICSNRSISSQCREEKTDYLMNGTWQFTV